MLDIIKDACKKISVYEAVVTVESNKIEEVTAPEAKVLALKEAIALGLPGGGISSETGAMPSASGKMLDSTEALQEYRKDEVLFGTHGTRLRYRNEFHIVAGIGRF